jgi:GDP-mannose 6-dehydrogenase
MTIGIFGLGYVGVTTAACLANDGHHVTGVDIVEQKVRAIEQGASPIVEERVGTLISKGCAQGRLRATMNPAEVLEGADLAFVCVGTPSQDDGSIDTTPVQRVATEIGKILSEQPEGASPLLIVFRSTMLPETTRNTLIPILEDQSGRAVGNGYEVAFHPEFMREGSAVHDFYHPPKIVVGERQEGAADRLWDLYEDHDAPQFATSLEAAEAVKYVDNAFHALKITFANEVGQILRAHGVDSREVMEIFRHDTKLNISPKYLRPGFAFGGSCLPKDLRALTQAAQEKSVDPPVLDNILTSNKQHIERALRRVVDEDPDRVGLVGLSFKPGTDDLRESPLVELAERLLGKGMEVRIFDQKVRTSKLVGTNKSYVERHLPHLSELLVESVEDLEPSDVIVVGHPIGEERIDDWTGQSIHVLDLVGASEKESQEQYEGIAW